MKNLPSSEDRNQKRRRPVMLFGTRQRLRRRVVIVSALLLMLCTTGLVIYFQVSKVEMVHAIESGDSHIANSGNQKTNVVEKPNYKKEEAEVSSVILQDESVEKNASTAPKRKKLVDTEEETGVNQETERKGKEPYSQYTPTGVGNHLTMSLQNCSQVAPNVVKFDIYVVSDGESSSDLRANAFQCGINFNPEWKSTAIEISYEKGSSDFPELNGFSFPMSPYSDHIRIVQAPFSKGNTGKTMKVGQPYRIGTFKVTSPENFVAGQNPDFSMQTTTVGGKTLCAAIAWIADAPTTSAVKIANSGTPAMLRVSPNRLGSGVPLNATVDCRLSSSEAVTASSLFVYPNPAKEKVTVSFNYGRDGADYHISLLDMRSRRVMIKDGKTVEGSNKMELDLSNLAKGVYLVDLRSSEYNGQSKITIE